MEESIYLVSKVKELEDRIKNLEEKLKDEAWRYCAIKRASEDWADAHELFDF